MSQPWRDADRLRELYHDQQLNQQEIADRFGCAKTTVSKWMRRHGIDTDPGRPSSASELADPEYLRQLYHGEELSLADIAAETGGSPATVHMWMDRHGIERRTKSDAVSKALRAGPAYFQTQPSGYEKWNVYDSGDRYTVSVHRLVAVAEYGLEAVTGQVVHHENHIPWDNRPSNLSVMGREEHSRYHREEYLDARN